MSKPTDDERERRVAWLHAYCEQLENRSIHAESADGFRYACPCCAYLTLDERGGFEICAVCFWEDDGQDDRDADIVRGGPNGSLSLTQARANFQAFGACERKSLEHVRKPMPDEIPGKGD
jgi:hypothetical protein